MQVVEDKEHSKHWESEQLTQLPPETPKPSSHAVHIFTFAEHRRHGEVHAAHDPPAVTPKPLLHAVHTFTLVEH